jgi:hypothetical protein
MQSTKINEGSRKILERRGNASTASGPGGNESVSIEGGGKEQRDATCRQSLCTIDKKPLQEAKAEESDRAARPTPSKSRQSLLISAKGAEDSPSTKRSVVSGREAGHQQAKQKDLVARLKAAEQEVVALRDVCLQALAPTDGQRQAVDLESFSKCQRDGMPKDELLQLAGRIFCRYRSIVHRWDGMELMIYSFAAKHAEDLVKALCTKMEITEAKSFLLEKIQAM